MTTDTNKKPGMTGPQLRAQLAEYPDRLLDAVTKKLQLKNDAALSRALGVMPPVISKIRHRTLTTGPALLLRILEVTDLSVRDLHDLSMRNTRGTSTRASRARL